MCLFLPRDFFIPRCSRRFAAVPAVNGAGRSPGRGSPGSSARRARTPQDAPLTEWLWPPATSFDSCCCQPSASARSSAVIQITSSGRTAGLLPENNGIWGERSPPGAEAGRSPPARSPHSLIQRTAGGTRHDGYGCWPLWGRGTLLPRALTRPRLRVGPGRPEQVVKLLE